MSKFKSVFLGVINFLRLTFHYLKYNFKAHFRAVGLFIFLSFLVVVGIWNWRWYLTSTPQKTIQGFIIAFEGENIEEALEYIYPDDRKQVRQNLKVFFDSTEADFSDVKIELLDKDERTARVLFKANLNWKIGDGSEGLERIENEVNLVKLDNRWYLHTLPVSRGREKE